MQKKSFLYYNDNSTDVCVFMCVRKYKWRNIDRHQFIHLRQFAAPQLHGILF